MTRPQKLAYQARYWWANGRPERARQIESELYKAGRCRQCGRKLSDPLSLARGTGPECWGRLGGPAPASDVFVQMAQLVEVAREQVLPLIADENLKWFFDARFTQLRRDVEFVDLETMKFRKPQHREGEIHDNR